MMKVFEIMMYLFPHFRTMEVEMVRDQYTTFDGIIGIIVFLAGMTVLSLVMMFSSTAYIVYTWMSGKSRNPLGLVLANILSPLFALWGK